MNIVWFSWKDINNPNAGGAELVTHEILSRLAKNNNVTLLTSIYSDAKTDEFMSNYRIIRLGDKWSVYSKTKKYFDKYLTQKTDLVIEEINTIPFFVKTTKNTKKFLFFHQLCREIWFYQMWFPLNLIGYLIEPIYLYMLSKNEVITISKSTKNDLLKYGFNEQNIDIVSEGIDINPIENIYTIEKNPNPTILSLGNIRAMKRTLDQIEAFEIAKKDIKNLKLIIAGKSEGNYGKKVLNYIRKSRYKNDIKYLGRISKNDKIKLMQKCQIILVTSVKEGWGLIVTEANSQGTPAIVYNIDGLRDSVKDNITGLICNNNNPECLANGINELLTNKTKYHKFQTNALAWSKKINFQNSYQDFIKIISND